VTIIQYKCSIYCYHTLYLVYTHTHIHKRLDIAIFSLWILTDSYEQQQKMAPINSSRSNALSVLQCNCCQKKNCDTPLHCYLSHLASSYTNTCFTDILKLFKLHVFSVFINKNYFFWELNAQNLLMMMMMIHCYNLLWTIKGPTLLWIYFLLYQHQCTQNTLKLQETSVFNFLEIVWLMVSHQIFNLTRHTLFQNMLPYKVLFCQHPDRPINIHSLHL